MPNKVEAAYKAGALAALAWIKERDKTRTAKDGGWPAAYTYESAYVLGLKIEDGKWPPQAKEGN